VQASIDTTVQSCEIRKGGGEEDSVEMSLAAHKGGEEGENTCQAPRSSHGGLSILAYSSVTLNL
jgi:hypothetical protein